MRSARLWLSGIVLLLATTPARATWFEASTDHFVVVADASEDRVRDFTTKLERFDAALRLLYGVADDPSRKSNPVRIFATNRDTIVKLCEGCISSVAGFYQPRAGGSVIFTSTLSGDGNLYDLNAQQILLHEYSHHFMFSSFPISYPKWYTEGFAEFNANVKFMPDGSIYIGYPANYRSWGLFGSQEALPIRELLEPSKETMTDPQSVEVFYARGWLLTHYLMLHGDRRAQLSVYLAEMNKGKSSLEAAKQAFGDISGLGHDLAAYLAKRQLVPLLVPAPRQSIAPVLRPLSPGEVAMMPVEMRSAAIGSADFAKAHIDDAEHRAAPFADDSHVQAELARAEFMAGNDAAADTAADRALAIDPENATALLCKGRVAVRRGVASKSGDKAVWRAARAWYVKANRLDPDAALPLLLYYESFAAVGETPPESALNGLKRAEVLAPEDNLVRWLLARHLLEAGDAASARFLLQPVAFAPHQRAGQNEARAIVDLIDAGKIDEARRKMTGGDAAKADKGKS